LSNRCIFRHDTLFVTPNTIAGVIHYDSIIFLCGSFFTEVFEYYEAYSLKHLIWAQPAGDICLSIPAVVKSTLHWPYVHTIALKSRLEHGSESAVFDAINK